MILEAGLLHGPLWTFYVMLFGAGLTGFYTLRMTWLVFFDAPRSDLHVHPSGNAIKFATAALALGTLSTWLLAGPLSGFFAKSLPFHALEELSTWQMAEEVLLAPGTWLALSVIACGAGLWVFTRNRSAAGSMRQVFDGLVNSSFGFETLNRHVLSLVVRVSTVLQKTQTGQLNWNILGIIGALLVVLVVLFRGA